MESTQTEIAGALCIFRYHRKLPGASQLPYSCHRRVAEVVKPPLTTGMDVAGKDGAAAKAVSAAAAAPSHLSPHVAKPWSEEPDAGNLHVRIRGSLGE